MTDPRAVDDIPLNAPDVGGPAKLAGLRGEELHGDQDGAITADEIDAPGVLTDTELYEGELEARGGSVLADGALSQGGPFTALEPSGPGELRAGETGNPDVAAEEGLTWVPPVDPPVVADAGAPGGASVAAGFGMTAQDEPFDADHHATPLPADDEVSARVREALLADSRTSRLAGRLGIDTADGIVRVLGTVDDLDDGDLVVEVASEVTGVTEVRDETEVPGL